MIRVILSALDGGQNGKTGPMVQVYVLPEEHPREAITKGTDTQVCGSCSRRSTASGGDGSCYAAKGSAALAAASAWRKAARENRYLSPIPRKVRYPVRFGAYGDPSRIPANWARELRAKAGRWTGYTEDWKTHVGRGLSSWLMASVNSSHERKLAKALGYRTFRVLAKGETLEPGEIACPASKEAGNRTQCSRCLLCDGKRGPSDHRKDVAIQKH